VSATEELVASNTGGKNFGGTTACIPPPQPLGVKKGIFCVSGHIFVLFLDLMKPKQAKAPHGGGSHRECPLLHLYKICPAEGRYHLVQDLNALPLGPKAQWQQIGLSA